VDIHGYLCADTSEVQNLLELWGQRGSWGITIDVQGDLLLLRDLKFESPAGPQEWAPWLSSPISLSHKTYSVVDNVPSQNRLGVWPVCFIWQVPAKRQELVVALHDSILQCFASSLARTAHWVWEGIRHRKWIWTGLRHLGNWTFLRGSVMSRSSYRMVLLWCSILIGINVWDEAELGTASRRYRFVRER